MVQVLSVILGLILLAGGGYLISIWYMDLWTVFKGCIGVTLVIVGIGVLIFAVSSIKEAAEERRREREERERAVAEKAKAEEAKPAEEKPAEEEKAEGETE